MPPSNHNNHSNNLNQRRTGGTIIQPNETNNITSVFPDYTRNTTNNRNNNLNSNSNNRALRSLSTINQTQIKNRNHNQNKNSNNFEDNLFQDFNLFPFINEEMNSDIGD